MNKSKLAINGGEKVRDKHLPYRKAFGEPELEMVKKVFKNSWKEGVDFGFQEKYEKLFTEKFCEFQRGGFADAVSSGTAAVYIALKALNIDKNAEIIVSPVTSPGGIMPLAIAKHKIIIPDSGKDYFNITPEEFEKVITHNTKAAVLTHLGGNPFEADKIVKIAHENGIKIIEDCSQAPGAIYKDKKVGTFGDIAVLSTMFSKNLATGGCGGLVYTNNEDYYRHVRYLADRGKPYNVPNFNFKNSTDYLFPALNFNQDELSCAIGISTLSKLQQTIDKRTEITQKIDKALEASAVVSPTNFVLPQAKPSPFFHTVKVNVNKIKVSKEEFAKAIMAEGIWINHDYKDITSEWKWVQKYNRKITLTPNAINLRNKTFNILFNEQFTNAEIEDIINSILKVESHYIK